VNELRFRILSKSRKPETFFQRLSHRASEIKGFGSGFLKLIQILREMTSGPERRFVPESRFGGRKDSQKVLL
jgi:hypothetical protein